MDLEYRFLDSNQINDLRSAMFKDRLTHLAFLAKLTKLAYLLRQLNSHEVPEVFKRA